MIRANVKFVNKNCAPGSNSEGRREVTIPRAMIELRWNNSLSHGPLSKLAPC